VTYILHSYNIHAPTLSTFIWFKLLFETKKKGGNTLVYDIAFCIFSRDPKFAGRKFNIEEMMVLI
jgi:hypothetical protein